MLLIKSYIFIAVLLFGAPENNTSSTDEFWQTDYIAAMSSAKLQDKPVMLYFSGSDWCKPCIIWKKEVFDTEIFQQYAKGKMVSVKLDFPRLKKNRLPDNQVKQNEELAGKYNSEGVFPMVVFINKNGSVIEKLAYREGGPEEFIKYTDTILARNR